VLFQKITEGITPRLEINHRNGEVFALPMYELSCLIEFELIQRIMRR